MTRPVVPASGPHPGTAELDVPGRAVRTVRNVETHMQAILSGKFIAEAEAAGSHILGPARILISSGAGTAKSDQTESFPELPAKLRLGLGHVVTLVSHGCHAAHEDKGPQVKRHVPVAENRIPQQAERQVAS